MKFRTIKMTLLSAVALAGSLLAFTGGQPAKVSTPPKQDTQDSTGIPRALQQGKGTGMSLSEKVISANAYREQTPAESAVARDSASRDQGGAPQPRWSDTAFRK